MNQAELEDRFRQWWPYPVPPNKQSITWATAWADHLLQTLEPSTSPPTQPHLEGAVEATSQALLDQLTGSMFSSPEDYARRILKNLADVLEPAGHTAAALALRDAAQRSLEQQPDPTTTQAA